MKPCPTGCGSNVKPGHLMCGCCWNLVPRPLQVEVYRTWDEYRKPRANRSAETIIKATVNYRKAADAAIAAAR